MLILLTFADSADLADLADFSDFTDFTDSADAVSYLISSKHQHFMGPISSQKLLQHLLTVRAQRVVFFFNIGRVRVH